MRVPPFAGMALLVCLNIVLFLLMRTPRAFPKESLDVVQQYRTKFSREPPPNFEGWLLFARGQQCETDLDYYEQIYKDLDPWIRKG
ncbi:hypothetical protein HDU98_010198, partial [Podochytrium sp. JEL0797]